MQSARGSCLSKEAAEESAAGGLLLGAEEPSSLCWPRTGLGAMLEGPLFCGSLPMPALAAPPSRAAFKACRAIPLSIKMMC